MLNEVFSFTASPMKSGQKIRFFHGDLLSSKENYDVVVCSAFRGCYTLERNSLIGALWREKSISLADLSMDPELDFRFAGCWLSREIKGSFRRVACLELLDYQDWFAQRRIECFRLLKSAFSTLRYLLEQADAKGIPIRAAALPILAAGYQGIELEYILPPLLAQCTAMFSTIEPLERIDFYEISDERIARLQTLIPQLFPGKAAFSPNVFISYSTKQTDWAHSVSAFLDKKGLSTWIAPESIAPGADYVRAIPSAIAGAQAVLLLLTEDAQSSRWVPNEVSSAIGAGKALIPVQPYPFTPNIEFQFLLERAQILQLWQFEESRKMEEIASAVENRLAV